MLDSPPRVANVVTPLIIRTLLWNWRRLDGRTVTLSRKSLLVDGPQRRQTASVESAESADSGSRRQTTRLFSEQHLNWTGHTPPSLPDLGSWRHASPWQRSPWQRAASEPGEKSRPPRGWAGGRGSPLTDVAGRLSIAMHLMMPIRLMQSTARPPYTNTERSEYHMSWNRKHGAT